MKKFLSLFCCAIIAISLLSMATACGKNPATSSPTTDPSAALTDTPEDLCDMTEGTFTTSKGQNIFGALVLPKDRKEDEKLPTIVMCHGYGSSYTQPRDKAYYFASEGFACYAFDFCGGGGESKSDGDFNSTMTIDTEVDDLEEVIAYLSEMPFVDTNKIFLYGESQGGFISIIEASKYPDKFAGLMLFYPGISIPKSAHEGNALTKRENYVASCEQYYGKEDEMMKACKMPVMLLHGDADTMVDVSYSQHAVQVFPNAKLIVVKKGGHGMTRKTLKKYYPELFAFLKEAAK